MKLFPPCAFLTCQVKVGSCFCVGDATAHTMEGGKHRQSLLCTAVGWAVLEAVPPVLVRASGEFYGKIIDWLY